MNAGWRTAKGGARRARARTVIPPGSLLEGRRMTVGWLKFLFFACAVLSPGDARGMDGREVIRRQQQRYEKLTSISARFRKSHYWKLVDQKTELGGSLYVRKPNQFRFETRVQTVVSDGEIAWNYTPENEQVLLSSYDRATGDRSYEKLLFDLILLGGYESRYDPRLAGEERVDGRRCYRVELTAREEESYISRIRLWIDRKLWLVRRAEYLNLNDDVTTYEISRLKVDGKLKPALFTFVPPDGVEVIDLR